MLCRGVNLHIVIQRLCDKKNIHRKRQSGRRFFILFFKKRYVADRFGRFHVHYRKYASVRPQRTLLQPLFGAWAKTAQKRVTGKKRCPPRESSNQHYDQLLANGSESGCNLNRIRWEGFKKFHVMFYGCREIDSAVQHCDIDVWFMDVYRNLLYWKLFEIFRWKFVKIKHYDYTLKCVEIVNLR